MSNAMQFKARIKNLALKNHVPAQAVLQNFMLERLLERISLSNYKNQIILKGGMLIASMVGISSRIAKSTLMQVGFYLKMSSRPWQYSCNQNLIDCPSDI